MTPLHFTPLCDFYSPETRNQYHAGLGYTAIDERLVRLVRAWVDRGLVRVGRTNGEITGYGVVT